MEIGVWKMVRAHESDDSIRYGNVFTYLYVLCYVYKGIGMEIGSGKWKNWPARFAFHNYTKLISFQCVIS